MTAFNKTFQATRNIKELNEFQENGEVKQQIDNYSSKSIKGTPKEETPKVVTPKKELKSNQPSNFSCSKDFSLAKINENLKTPQANTKSDLFDKIVGTVSPIFKSIAKTIAHSRSDNNLDFSSKLFNYDNMEDRKYLYSSSKKRHPERFPIIHDSNNNYMRTFDECKPEDSQQNNLKENKDFKNIDNYNDIRKSS